MFDEWAELAQVGQELARRSRLAQSRGSRAAAQPSAQAVQLPVDPGRLVPSEGWAGLMRSGLLQIRPRQPANPNGLTATLSLPPGEIVLDDFWVPEPRRRAGLLHRFLGEAQEQAARSGRRLRVRGIVGLFMLHACVRRGFEPQFAPAVRGVLIEPDGLRDRVARISRLVAAGELPAAEAEWDSWSMRQVAISMCWQPG